MTRHAPFELLTTLIDVYLDLQLPTPTNNIRDATSPKPKNRTILLSDSNSNLITEHLNLDYAYCLDVSGYNSPEN